MSDALNIMSPQIARPGVSISSARADTAALKIAFVVGGLETESSGVGRIACELANAMGRAGSPVSLYTARCPGRPFTDHLIVAPSRCIAEPGRWRMRLAQSPALRRRLEADLPAVDVVHNHSVWMLPNHYATSIAHRLGKTVMYTAHGFLEPWALRRSRWKKRVAGWWFQNRDLRRAACIHVNSDTEVRSIRDYGLTNPIAVIPNGVDTRPFDKAVADRAAIDAAFPRLRGRRVALFLSRLHEKKGLGHLLPAWARVARDHDDWALLIVGPDDGYGATSRAMARDLGTDDRVVFAGSRVGEDKVNILASADAFVLPSFSEGFAMAILEALAARLPVLITPGCNFSQVVEADAGVCVEPTIDDTERGLRALLAMSDEDRRAMGQRGRDLVDGAYTWDAVAAELSGVYRWMVGGGDPPACVQR
ncbi:MAG: glycosyltransferase [Phycisphaera sp.]|nr:glycosyltransferase [Phycisphaera sp.]